MKNQLLPNVTTICLQKSNSTDVKDSRFFNSLLAGAHLSVSSMLVLLSDAERRFVELNQWRYSVLVLVFCNSNTTQINNQLVKNIATFLNLTIHLDLSRTVCSVFEDELGPICLKCMFFCRPQCFSCGCGVCSLHIKRKYIFYRQPVRQGRGWDFHSGHPQWALNRM